MSSRENVPLGDATNDHDAIESDDEDLEIGERLRTIQESEARLQPESSDGSSDEEGAVTESNKAIRDKPAAPSQDDLDSDDDDDDDDNVSPSNTPPTTTPPTSVNLRCMKAIVTFMKATNEKTLQPPPKPCNPLPTSERHLQGLNCSKATPPAVTPCLLPFTFHSQS